MKYAFILLIGLTASLPVNATPISMGTTSKMFGDKDDARGHEHNTVDSDDSISRREYPAFFEN